MANDQRKPTWQLHYGAWQDHIPSEPVDAVITDPPYSKRTHRGQSETRADESAPLDLGYAHWGLADIREAVEVWTEVCTGWICVQTSHDLIPAWEDALWSRNRFVFAPVPIIMPGMSVRLQGDGPSSWAVYMVVARPRTVRYARWGTLPGFYKTPPNRDGIRAGGKPERLMRAIVRDYSRRGDIVWDPCAGGGSTLRAAMIESRSAIGCEVDRETYEAALRRMNGGHQIPLL